MAYTQYYFSAEETLMEKSGVGALDGLFKILSERNRELSELNRTLEEKFTMRTRKLREANLGLERLSLIDFLAQLPDRRYDMQMLTHAMEE